MRNCVMVANSLLQGPVKIPTRSPLNLPEAGMQRDEALLALLRWAPAAGPWGA